MTIPEAISYSSLVNTGRVRMGRRCLLLFAVSLLLAAAAQGLFIFFFRSGWLILLAPIYATAGLLNLRAFLVLGQRRFSTAITTYIMLRLQLFLHGAVSLVVGCVANDQFGRILYFWHTLGLLSALALIGVVFFVIAPLAAGLLAMYGLFPLTAYRLVPPGDPAAAREDRLAADT